MVYSDDDDFALANNYDSWEDYIAAKPGFPTKKKLTRDRLEANGKINRWTGSKNVDIADEAYTDYLRDLEVEVIQRIHDKGVDRKAGEAKGIYSPHDHLYVAERNYLVSIGVATGNRRKRGVR